MKDLDFSNPAITGDPPADAADYLRKKYPHWNTFMITGLVTGLQTLRDEGPEESARMMRRFISGMLYMMEATYGND